MAINAAELTARVGADTSDAERKLTSIGKTVDGLGTSTSKAGALASVASTGFAVLGVGVAALGVGVASAIGKASSFQAVISQVGAVSGATAPQLQSLSDLALQMGADTAFSAAEAAQAMAELAKGGIAVEQMASVLPGVLDLAAAGGLTLAESATIATDSMAIFASQGVTMDRVANAFAGAANISSISVSDMASAMAYAGPAAAALGLSLEDTSAAIALLGANGIKGSSAGTGLRTVLTSLAAPTDKAKALMSDLGLSFFDANGKMLDMTGISEQLKSKLGGMSDAQRIATLETLAGKEGMGALIALMGTGENSIQSYTQKLASAATAHATGKAMMDNFAGSMDAFKGSIETASITLGLMLLPYLRDLVDWGTKAVNASVPLIQAWGPKLVAGLQTGIAAVVNFGQRVGTSIGAVVDSFRKLLSGEINLGQFVGGITKYASAIISGIQNLAAQATGALLQLGTRFATWLTDALPQALTALGQFFSGLVNSITGTGGPAAEQAMSKSMTNAFTKWIEPTVGPFLAALGTLATTMFNFIVASTPTILATLGGWAVAFGDWVTNTAIPYLWPKLQLFLTTIATWVTGTALPAIGTMMLALGQTFGTWIQTTAIPYLQANLPPWLTALGTWITTTALPAIGTFLLTIGQAFGTWVTTTAIPFLQANLPIWLAALSEWITGTAVPAINAFLDSMGQAFGTWVTTSAIPYLQTNLPLWLAALGEWISGTAVPAVAEAASHIATALGEWINTAGPAWLHDWGELGTVVDEKLGEILAALGTWAVDTATKVGEWFNTAGPTWLHDWGELGTVAKEKIADVLTALGTFASDIATKVGDWINTAGPAWLHDWGTLVTTVKEKVADVIAAAKNIATDVVSAIGDLSGLLVQKGKDLVQGLINGIDSMIGEAKKKAGELASAVADAVTGLFKSKSPSRLAMGIGNDFVDGLTIGMDEKQGEAAAKAASVASAVAKAATDILGAIGAVAGFDFAKNSPTGETLGWFRHMAASIVQTLADVATMLGTEALDKAKKVAESTGQIGSAVKSTLDGFKSLAEYDFTKGSPTGDAMGWFRHLMESIVLNFAQAAQLVGTEGMAQATAFATTVADVVNAGKGALELFTKLAEYKGLPQTALEGILGAMGGAIQVAKENVNAAQTILGESQAFLDVMREAQSNFLAGLAIGSSLPSAGAASGAGQNLSLTLPALADGGIVTRPTIALIGERGPEAVVPLDGARRSGGGTFGGGGNTVNITFEYHDHAVTGDRARLAEFAQMIKPEIDRVQTMGY